MEFNNEIDKEIENTELHVFKSFLKKIDGKITTEKVYQEVFTKNLNVNYYVDIHGVCYIELQKYIDNVTKGECKERQILFNKGAVDHTKIVRFHEINIKEKYEVNRLTPGKRLIRVDGLATVNDSIKRFSKQEIDVNFFNWQKLCELIIFNLPKIIEASAKRVFKKKFEDIDSKFKNQEKELEVLKQQNIHLQEQINTIKRMIK